MIDVETLLRQQESLRRVIELISSELELRSLLTEIVRGACELLGAQRGTIGLVDSARNVVRTEATFNMPPDEFGAEMGPGEGLAGQVLETRQPIVLDRYGQLPQPTQANLADDPVIGMPIFWQGEMIGFFGIGAPPGHRFEPHHVETLAYFAHHAAIAIVNARRHEAERNRTERFELVARLGQQIAARRDPDELIVTVARELHERLGFPHVSLFLIDPADPRQLVQRARASRWPRKSHGIYRQSIDVGVLGAAAQSRRPYRVDNVEVEPGFVPVPGADGLRAELAVPIQHGERLLGVLDVAGDTAFSDEDERVLMVIADQLVVALDNAQLFAQTQSALVETRLLYRTAQRISRADDVDGVIEAYLAQVAARGRYACSIVLYEEDHEGRRANRVMRGYWSPDRGIVRDVSRQPYARDALDDPLDRGETVLIDDVEQDPRVTPDLLDLQRRRRRPALAMIPLMAGSERIGLVVLSHDRVRNWSEADVRPYEVTAAQLATAIASRRQTRLLYARGQRLAVLEERQRLARELHDSVTQLIFSIMLHAQSLTPAWERDTAEGKERVARLLELSRRALAEMRALLAELSPPEPPAPGEVLSGIQQLRAVGVLAALESHTQGMVRDGPDIRFESDGYPAPGADDQPPPEIEETLFRIGQEALANVIKHASAKTVLVRLERRSNHVRLVVQDDGVGFDITGLARREAGEGLGLRSIRDRLASLDGRLELETRPGAGCTLRATLPLDPALDQRRYR